ncbi:uncharacterized protein [Spinacia oleracea]|uniref:Uncharacterized protein n=1 Tax=Spinacia oleracea TaxID=3562 RepID=A0ABM3RPN1_SPIOL|nr:uncharacterized protein LOC130471462 [Spinacia oleracea]
MSPTSSLTTIPTPILPSTDTTTSVLILHTPRGGGVHPCTSLTPVSSCVFSLSPAAITSPRRLFVLATTTLGSTPVSSYIMYEFKTNHGEWITSMKSKFGDNVSGRVRTAIKSVPQDVKAMYKVRTELCSALQNLLIRSYSILKSVSLQIYTDTHIMSKLKDVPISVPTTVPTTEPTEPAKEGPANPTRVSTVPTTVPMESTTEPMEHTTVPTAPTPVSTVPTEKPTPIEYIRSPRAETYLTQDGTRKWFPYCVEDKKPWEGMLRYTRIAKVSFKSIIFAVEKVS